MPLGAPSPVLQLVRITDLVVPELEPPRAPRPTYERRLRMPVRDRNPRPLATKLQGGISARGLLGAESLADMTSWTSSVTRSSTCSRVSALQVGGSSDTAYVHTAVTTSDELPSQTRGPSGNARASVGLGSNRSGSNRSM